MTNWDYDLDHDYDCIMTMTMTMILTVTEGYGMKNEMRGNERKLEGKRGNEREREGLRGNEGSSLQADRQDKIQYHKEKLRNPKVKQRSTAGKKCPKMREILLVDTAGIICHPKETKFRDQAERREFSIIEN